MKKRIAVVLVALVLSISCIIGTTLAWLTDTTNEVKNTFTYGDINISLDETGTDINNDPEIKEVEYKMVPGTKLDKNPVVTVEPNSEACWLFVEIVENGKYNVVVGKNDDGSDKVEIKHFDDYIAYAIDTGWTTLKTTEIDGNTTTVIYREVGETDATTTDDDKFAILGNGEYSCLEQGNAKYTWANDQVLVKPCVTKQMMEALMPTGTALPSLTFTSYAVQSENVASAEAAWAIAKPTT